MSDVKQLDGSKLPHQVDVGPVVRLIMQTCGSDDAALIHAALGDSFVTSFAQLAKVFGVRESTCKNTWSRDGLPRSTKRGPGQRSRFPLAAIVIWALRRADAAGEGRRRASSNGVRSDAARGEILELEVATARATLQLKQMRISEATGDTISLSLVRSEMGSVLSVLREDITDIPRHIKPILPAKLAETIVREIDRFIRLSLTRISEQSQETIIDRCRQKNEQSNSS